MRGVCHNMGSLCPITIIFIIKIDRSWLFWSTDKSRVSRIVIISCPPNPVILWLLRALSSNHHFLHSTFPCTFAYECIFCPAFTYCNCSGLFHSDWQVNSCLTTTHCSVDVLQWFLPKNIGTHTVTAPDWLSTQSTHFGSSFLLSLIGQLSRTIQFQHTWNFLLKNLNLLVTFAAPTHCSVLLLQWFQLHHYCFILLVDHHYCFILLNHHFCFILLDHHFCFILLINNRHIVTTLHRVFVDAKIINLVIFHCSYHVYTNPSKGSSVIQ